jgi:hypothetical protein
LTGVTNRHAEFFSHRFVFFWVAFRLSSTPASSQCVTNTGRGGVERGAGRESKREREFIRKLLRLEENERERD